MKEGSNPTALTDEDFKQMIFDAEILLRSPYFEQRERGREILLEVVDLAAESTHAERAKKLLAAAENRVFEPTDPELEKLKSDRSLLHDAKDYRLVNFLKRLENYHGKAMSLRADVIGALLSWISLEVLQVDEVESLHRSVEDLVHKIATYPPSNWSETRLQAELLAQLETYLNHATVPSHWKSQLQMACDRLSDLVKQFIRAQASASVTVQQLRDFQMEFSRLPVAIADGCCRMDEDSFRQGLESLIDQTSRNAERAHNTNELKNLTNNLLKEAEALPQAVAARLGEMVEVISKNAAEWKAMQDGHAFQMPLATHGPLSAPTAWRADMARYEAWLQQIERAFKVIRSETGAASEEDYQESLLLANGILSELPDHALARNLKRESTRGVVCYQLDRALLSWNLDAFFDLSRNNSSGELYTGLLASKHVLLELKALTSQPTLADWQAARNWWTGWRTISNGLPSAKPDALSKALAQENRKRYQEWYRALDQLLRDNHSPREYREAAKSLEDETDKSLRKYQRQLLRIATIGRIQEQIKKEQFTEAEQGLRELPPNSKDAKRLWTQLKVRQARLGGSVAAAEYISSDWKNVRTYAEQPVQILLETLRGVWSEAHNEWVTKLKPLLAPAVRMEKDAKTAQELNDWQTWVDIETGLLHDCSSIRVNQLAEYLRNAEPGELLDQRLDKILRQWQSNKNLVMLAWAYQAFRGKSVVANKYAGAAAELINESDKVADNVLLRLNKSGALEPFDLELLLGLLQSEEKRWQALQGILSQDTVEQWRRSKKFTQANATLNELLRIWNLLAQLQKTDLRQPSSRRVFDEAYSSADRLKGIASRKQLLDNLERLRPHLGTLLN